MNRKRILLGVLAGLLFLSVATEAHAQKQYRRYSPPAGPAITPYLNYFRTDTGVLDPYNAIVAPRRQLDRELSYLNRQQQYDAQETRQQFDQIRKSGAAPTGVGGTHMNLSHYYQMPTSQGKPARR